MWVVDKLEREVARRAVVCSFPLRKGWVMLVVEVIESERLISGRESLEREGAATLTLLMAPNLIPSMSNM